MAHKVQRKDRKQDKSEVTMLTPQEATSPVMACGAKASGELTLPAELDKLCAVLLKGLTESMSLLLKEPIFAHFSIVGQDSIHDQVSWPFTK